MSKAQTNTYTLLSDGVRASLISSGEELLPTERLVLSNRKYYIHSLTYTLQPRRSTGSKGDKQSLFSKSFTSNR